MIFKRLYYFLLILWFFPAPIKQRDFRCASTCGFFPPFAGGLILLIACLFIVGCGDGEEEPQPVNFVSANPPGGSTITPDATLTVTFDAAPGEVAANPGTATVAGQTVTISGPFSAGSLSLALTWADGFHVLNYTVTAPKPPTESQPSAVNFVSVNPPSGSTVEPDGTITATFDGIPGGVTVNSGAATVAGRTVTISGPFPTGALSLNITWADGFRVLNYTVTAPKPPPVNFVAVDPPSGSTIEPDGTITATFDAVPDGVVVSSGTATVTGQIVTISGPFPAGALNLNITWADGAHSLTYTVNLPLPEGMVLIPAGEFQMGSNDPEARNNEQPVHTVYVDAFFMDETEVTNAQYKKFVDANPGWGKRSIDGAFHNGNYLKHWNGDNYPVGKSNHPVTYVSWYAAMAYSQWAGKRLPTEAEWEYAARGGLRGQKYPWGNDIDRGRANYNNNVGDTTAVRKYGANGYGLFDMAGNVWEWCLDEYDAGFYARSPRDNPISGANTVDWVIDNFTNVRTSRVLRGGSWNAGPEDLRVASRGRNSPTGARNFSGFRCARSQ